MSYKARRQLRFEYLKQLGFLDFEAAELSQLSKRVLSDTPYIRDMLKDRAKVLQEAINRQWGKANYIKWVKELYSDKKWTRRTKTGRVLSDPWSLLRDYEDKYREKYPAYTSPWQRQPRILKTILDTHTSSMQTNMRDWINQLEVNIAKAKTPERKAQLEKQKRNLESWLK